MPRNHISEYVSSTICRLSGRSIVNCFSSPSLNCLAGRGGIHDHGECVGKVKTEPAARVLEGPSGRTPGCLRRHCLRLRRTAESVKKRTESPIGGWVTPVKVHGQSKGPLGGFGKPRLLND